MTCRETMETQNKKKSLLGCLAFGLLCVGCDAQESLDAEHFESSTQVQAQESLADVHTEESQIIAEHLGAIPEPPPPVHDERSSEKDFRGATYSLGWSEWISKNLPPRTCDVGSLVNGALCRGGWCKNLQIRCEHSRHGKASRRTWTSYFSEEKTNWRYCPDYSWMSGLVCRGKRCNDIAMECTKMDRAGSACRWSGWFSEEDPAFTAGGGRFIRGIQCGGDYCDNKRYYHCAI